MGTKRKIVLIEDEDGIREFVRIILDTNGYEVIECRDGVAGLQAVSEAKPDVVLLDLGLPDMDGLNILTSLRCWSKVPVIIISSRNNEIEKVAALDSGADDYITKPFGTEELLARIRTALRHAEQGAKSGETSMVFTTKGLSINYDKRCVTIDAEEVHMTPIEYRLLVLLSENVGRVLTYDSLMKSIWGPYVDERQSLRVNMANIRRKIEQDTTDTKYIKTEVGVGYRMME